MVVEQGEPMFVLWADARTRQGRRVTVDSSGRLVAIVRYATPVEDFKGAKIVVSNWGVPMHRMAKQFLPPMPGWVLDAQELLLVRGYTGPFTDCDLREARRRCALCEVAGLRVEDAGVVICKSCMSTLHRQCVRTLQELGVGPSEAVAPLGEFVCKICSERQD